MKKVLAILLCMGFILSASDPISAQEKPAKKSPTDTTGIKIEIPEKPVIKQKAKVKKQVNQENPDRFMRDPVLMMKEKSIDTLQKKTQ